MSSVRLQFHPSYSNVSPEYSLFELTPHILEELREKPDSVYIVGTKEADEAVLCTSSQTFRVRQADSSNSTLITTLPTSAGGPAEIYSTVTQYYELQKIPPRLHTLKEKLHQDPLDPELNDSDTPIGCSFESLLDQTQASEEEIRAGLAKEKAFEYQGRWQILSDRYEREIISHILLCISSDEEQSIFEPVRLRSIYSQLQKDMMNVPPLRVVRHVFSLLSSTVVREEADEIYCLDTTEIMKFYAVGLFTKNNTESIPVDEFLTKWNADCPAECRPEASLLHGVAVEVNKSGRAHFVYFPVEKLSTDVNQRFKELFALQPRWKLNAIQPYLKELAHTMTIEQLLFKHCRAIQSPEGKVYTKR